MPTGRLIDDLDRLAVDGFTRLTQWDQVFRRDEAVLTHEDWPVGWLWVRWGHPAEVSLGLDGEPAATTTRCPERVLGALGGRGMTAALRAEESGALDADERRALVWALGWPPMVTVHRRRSTELHSLLGQAALIASGSIWGDWDHETPGVAAPVVDRAGEPLGTVHAVVPEVDVAEVVVTHWGWEIMSGSTWTLAHLEDREPFWRAGWAAHVADMVGATEEEADAAALDILWRDLEQAAQ